MKAISFLRKTQITDWIGELYLIVSVLGYWGVTKAFINPVALVLLAILLTLVWSKSAILGSVIAMIFLLLNLYMVLALISEVNEFAEFNRRAIELLVGGSLYLGFNILASIFLLVKWGRRLG